MAWTDQFLKTGVPPSFRYFGGDIVAHVVAANTRRWAGDPNKKFGVVDISQTPVEPGYDLILCRDALQHLPYRMVFDALSNFAQSDAKFLLVGSYPNGEVDPACRDYRCGGKNCDLGVPGDHAFLVDLAKPPFGLKPDRIIKEGAGRPHCATDKYLYVFRISYLRTVDFRALKAAALA